MEWFIHRHHSFRRFCAQREWNGFWSLWKEKDGHFFLNLTHFEHRRIQNYFFLADGINISWERENPPTALFSAQQKSAELGLLLAGLHLTPTCRFFTHAIMLEAEVPNWMCDYSFCKRGQSPPSHSSIPYSLLQDDKPRSCLSVSVCLIWLDMVALPS